MKQDVERLVERFDHHDPDYACEGAPAAIYDVLRSKCPVAHSDAWGGFWVLTRYRDIAEVAKNPGGFSNRRGVQIPMEYPDEAPMPEEPLGIPLFIDPPESQMWRRVLSDFYSLERARGLMPGMRTLTNQLIDGFIENGHADFYEDLVAPMPAMVTCRIIGLPEEEWRTYAEPVHERLQSHPSVQQANDEQAQEATEAATQRLLELAEQRRRDPRDDLLTFLVNTKVQGRRLTETEIGMIAYVTLAGGVDTSTNAMGCQLVYLGRNPEARRRLAAEPSLIPLALEEFLRVWSPFQGLGRWTMADTEINGQPVKTGEKVFMAWQAANLDPEKFDDPHRVVLDRKPNPHLAFGLGPHRCIGMHIARAEMQVMLEEVLRRIPEFEVGDAELQPDCGLIYGYGRIPATFPAGKRED